MKVLLGRLVIVFILWLVFRSLLDVPSPYDFLAALFYELLGRIEMELQIITKIFKESSVMMVSGTSMKGDGS